MKATLVCNAKALILLAAATLACIGVNPTQAQTAEVASGVKLPEYTVQRTLGPIVIDGVLNEESWKRATSTGPFSTYPIVNSPRRTEAKLLWDNDRLYLAINCRDSDVRATRNSRDADIFAEDCFEFFIMEQRFGKKYGHFLEYQVNARGAMTDAYNVGDYEGIAGWESKGWKCAVKVDGTLNDNRDVDKGWTVEMSIPFFDFFGNLYQTEAIARSYLRGSFPQCTPVAGDRWRANLYRIKYLEKGTEYSPWSPNRPPKGFHDPERFGTFIFSATPAGTSLPQSNW